MTDSDKTVFISYRRGVSKFIARAVFQDLRQHGFDVFLDVENIDSGEFDKIILNQIAARAHFVVILTEGTLERCGEPGDWLRREVEYALDVQRNVVPVLIDDFKLDIQTQAMLTGQMSGLMRHNALKLYYEYFDEGLERLRGRYLKQPVYGAIQPVPAREIKQVEQKIEAAASEPTPTHEELSAEQLFIRAMNRSKEGDKAGAIGDYTEVISLNPGFVEAYNNRGILRRMAGDFKGALADYDSAVRLNPKYATVLNNRAVVRREMGDFKGALADHNYAIQLNGQNGNFYNNRGGTRYHMGDLRGAVTDYTHAIRRDSENAHMYYSNIGEAFFALGDMTKALAAFEKSDQLKPQYHYAVAGLAITLHRTGKVERAKELWQSLVDTEPRYLDATWVQDELRWEESLVEEARKVIEITLKAV